MTTATLPDDLTELSSLIMAAQAHLKHRALAQQPDIWSLIKGQEAAKRAIIVAAVQKHSMILIGRPHTSKTMLVLAAAQLGVAAVEVCIPANQIDNPHNWQVMYDRMLKRHAKDISRASIYAEVPDVPTRVMLKPWYGETLSQAGDRLSKAGGLPPETLDDLSKSLLQQAVTELQIPPGRIAGVISVARSIAALDHSDHIQIQHVAESVQYWPERILSNR